MKKVIVISTSLRRGSNSDMLADKFAFGAKSAGNDVEKISLVGKDIRFCTGCFGCQRLGKCVIKDDVNDIMAKVMEAEVVVWDFRKQLISVRKLSGIFFKQPVFTHHVVGGRLFEDKVTHLLTYSL